MLVPSVKTTSKFNTKRLPLQIWSVVSAWLKWWLVTPLWWKPIWKSGQYMFLSIIRPTGTLTLSQEGRKFVKGSKFAKNSLSCKAEGCWKDKKQLEQVKVGKTYVALTSACWDLSVSSFNVLLSWLKWFTWEVGSENVLINPESAWLPSAIHHFLAVRRENLSEVKEDIARKAGL